MSATLIVVRSGLLTTVQDQGRPQAVRLGVPRGGAIDQFALQAANRLVGNMPGAAALEITAGNTTFEAVRPTVIALTGGNFGCIVNGRHVPLWTTLFVRRGDQIALNARAEHWGARTYLAIAGGFDVPVVLGSRSTLLSSGFGGFGGRTLRQGDVLHAAEFTQDVSRMLGACWLPGARPQYQAEPTLRFIPGPHVDRFATSLTALTAKPLRIGQQSNRMGYRLEGLNLQDMRNDNLASLGVIPGVIQVPPDGAPILLMADAQTTGGYPIVGVVIAPDFPLAAQLLPGDTMRFKPVTQSEALQARRMVASWLQTGLASDGQTEQAALAGDVG